MKRRKLVEIEWDDPRDLAQLGPQDVWDDPSSQLGPEDVAAALRAHQTTIVRVREISRPMIDAERAAEIEEIRAHWAPKIKCHHAMEYSGWPGRSPIDVEKLLAAYDDACAEARLLLVGLRAYAFRWDHASQVWDCVDCQAFGEDVDRIEHSRDCGLAALLAPPVGSPASTPASIRSTRSGLPRAVIHPEDDGTASLRFVQRRIDRTWTLASYGVEFRADPRPHRDLAHALLHVQKASGRLAALVDDMDHGLGHSTSEIGKLLADLVICAARMASQVDNQTGLRVDLERQVLVRLDEIAARESDRAASVAVTP